MPENAESIGRPRTLSAASNVCQIVSIEVLIVIVPQQVPRGLFALVMGGLSHAPPPALAFSMHYPVPAAYFFILVEAANVGNLLYEKSHLLVK